jgi:hypothetical protein
MIFAAITLCVDSQRVFVVVSLRLSPETFGLPSQTGSGAHPASYPMGTAGSFRGGKAAGELS